MNTWPPPSPLRGLTLVEVLAATALLTMLAAAAVPMLRDVVDALRPPDEAAPEVSQLQLSALADRFMDAPHDFGVPKETPLSEVTTATLSWPEELLGNDQSALPAIEVQRLRANDSDGPAPKALDDGRSNQVGGTWLVFSCDDRLTVRWLPLPKPKDQSGEPGR